MVKVMIVCFQGKKPVGRMDVFEILVLISDKQKKKVGFSEKVIEPIVQTVQKL